MRVVRRPLEYELLECARPNWQFMVSGEVGRERLCALMMVCCACFRRMERMHGAESERRLVGNWMIADLMSETISEGDRLPLIDGVGE